MAAEDRPQHNRGAAAGPHRTQIEDCTHQYDFITTVTPQDRQRYDIYIYNTIGNWQMDSNRSTCITDQFNEQL
jgi:hypothetical protein